tara:strand:+ start:2503 stop:3876 length:1374 start_codon:yes stop_codon:yes gene_type:complete
MCDAVSGPNTGAIISLNAIGKQDTYLIENDTEKSFFKYNLKQHSNFTKFHKSTKVIKPGDASPSWPFNKTIKVTLNPRNMGDLLSNMYISLELPTLKIDNSGANPDYNYTDQVGRHLFKSITMRVDEMIVEKYHADWGIIYDELYLDESEKRTKRYTINRNIAEDTSISNIKLSRNKSKVFVPIPFFFSRKYESDEYETNKPNRPYFPLCAIHKQKIEFEIEFNPQSFFTDYPSNISLDSFDVVTEEISIDPSEKVYIKNNKYNFITDIVKKHPTLEINPGEVDKKIEIVANIPVKTLNWFIRKEKFENETIARELSQDNTTVDGLYTFHNRYNMSTQDTYTILNEFFHPPMHSAKIHVNGENVPNIQDSDHKYFKYTVPFTSRLSRPFRNIYTYAFSMNPINVESSGSLDFTQLRSNRTTLDVKMVPDLTDTYNLHIYYVGYQTFSFENGFMSLAY